ncbi:MAG: adenylosuccinate synthase [Bacteroidia bacterium]
MVDVLLGLQWGDEGKGKIADFLTPSYDVVARFQGGPNAGHSLEINGKKHVLNTIPSGIFHENCINLIGNGVVIDPILLRAEIEKTIAAGADVRSRLYISKKAHLILPSHRLLDAASEKAKGDDKIGSTLRGISPTYQDKTGRSGLRIGDADSPDFKKLYKKALEKHISVFRYYDFDYEEELTRLESQWFEAVEYLRGFNQVNSEFFLHRLVSEGKQILAEGAQGSLLDLDFGSYPYVTSSNTISGGACVGLGLAPKHIRKVTGIFKAYCTRVGSGPFPTELNDETGEFLRTKGHEFGATTGRPRRTGWLDLPALKYAIMLSGVDELIMMKADVLSGLDTINAALSYEGCSDEEQCPFNIQGTTVTPIYKQFPGWQEDISVMRQYHELPESFRNYIAFMETECAVPIRIISIGPDRAQTIQKT